MVRFWQIGQTDPKREQVVRLARFFDVPVGWLADPSDARSFGDVEREERWMRILRRLGIEEAEDRVLGVPAPMKVNYGKVEKRGEEKQNG
jgi:hypothetical protein